MIIQYICKECNSKRFLSKVEENVLCKNCSKPMEVLRNEITIDSITTPESRFMADEAIYNTVGRRVTNKHTS